MLQILRNIGTTFANWFVTVKPTSDYEDITDKSNSIHRDIRAIKTERDYYLMRMQVESFEAEFKSEPDMYLVIDDLWSNLNAHYPVVIN